mmetsp:Transcript_56729/g.127711  ORF Transcript_56729/g.127711 Transcript_56729/m.127711 type:complete len:780 (-) Transcript_56729:226-2565(-)
MPTYDPRSDGSSLADWSLEAEVFCSYVQAWVGGSIVSIDRDSVTVEFDLEAGHCRKKLRNGSQNLRLPPATRRQLQAIQERLEPEEISESEYAAELPPQLERAGEQQAPAFRSEETEESASEQRQEDSGSLTEEIDPGANFLPAEATKHIMEYIFVKRSGKEMQGLDCSDCHPSMLTSLAEMFFGGHRCFESRHADKKGSSLLPVKSYKNNSYAITQAFRGPVEVHYRGPERGDILVKVYVLEGSRHDDWDEYALVAQEDGMPAFLHSEHRRAPVCVPRAPGSGTFFLGLVVHRDLNADWLWRLSDEDLKKQFLRSTEGGFEARGEAKGERSACKAQYVLSWATADRELNNPLVKRLAEKPVWGPHTLPVWNWNTGNTKPEPITFCTDRSLGFGQHLIAEKVGADQKLNLYLAKHGFGKPVEQGVWFEEYLRAIMTVKCGMLILRDSPAYLASMACVRECTKIPQRKIFLLHPDHAKQSNPMIVSLEEALDKRSFKALRAMAFNIEHQRKIVAEADRLGHDGVGTQPERNEAEQGAKRLAIACWERSRSGAHGEALAILEEAYTTINDAGLRNWWMLVDIAELRLALGKTAEAEAALSLLPLFAEDFPWWRPEAWLMDDIMPEVCWAANALSAENGDTMPGRKLPFWRDRFAYVQCAAGLFSNRLEDAMSALSRLASWRLKCSAVKRFEEMLCLEREAMMHLLVQLVRDYWRQWGWLLDKGHEIQHNSGTRALLESLERQLPEATPERLLLPADAFTFTDWRKPLFARWDEASRRGFVS